MVREAVPLHCLLVGMILSLELAALPPDVRKASGFPDEVPNILLIGEAQPRR